MTCLTVRKKLAGYLDGALGGPEHAVLVRHLADCADCRGELEAHSRLFALLARSERAQPPSNLALRIRVAVAQERVRPSWFARVRRRVRLAFEPVFELVTVPTTSGVLMSLVIYALVLQSLFIGVPVGAVPNDLPINLIQPARLKWLAPFPLHVSQEGDIEVGGGVSMVEFTVNAEGRAVSYQILSGEADRDTRRQLDQLLLFSSFKPQLSFGRPTAGGRVVVRFHEYHVKG